MFGAPFSAPTPYLLRQYASEKMEAAGVNVWLIIQDGLEEHTGLVTESSLARSMISASFTAC